MRKIFIITCCFVFLRSFHAEEMQQQALDDDPVMGHLLGNIAALASKVLGIFEPLASLQPKNESSSDEDDTYFVSFQLNKNETNKPKQRMIVNNNFNGERLGSNQVFVESGPAAKQPASHNIQLLKARRAETQEQTQTLRNLMQQFQQQG